jgi:hypothetical protein
VGIVLFLKFPQLFFGNVKPIPGLAGQPSQGQAFLNLVDPKKWNDAVKALGGIGFTPELAQSQIDQYRQETGLTSPLLPPEAEAPAPAAPPVAEGEQPAQVQPDMVVRSYPPETYKSSAEFIDARLTGFERLHEGWGYDEGLGYQCVAGTKYYLYSALGMPIRRADGGFMLFAPSAPNPGFPGPAFEDFERKWNWVNNPTGPEPANSILPPKGEAKIDGKVIPYHTEIIRDVNALQRGDVVIFPIHVGEFSAYTQDGQLLLFDQNGTASMDPFTHHAFAKSNFVAAIRVVYHL